MATRKILPRKESSKYDSLSFGSFPEADKTFNDRKTLIFTSSLIDLPSASPTVYNLGVYAQQGIYGSETLKNLVSGISSIEIKPLFMPSITLTFFYSNTASEQRQAFLIYKEYVGFSTFYGLTVKYYGLTITGSLKPGLIDPFLRIDPSYNSSTKPFNETALFEQDNFDDPFFASGSAGEIGDGTFSIPLKNKAKINLSFSVTTKTTMLKNSSSIYYLNPEKGKWNIPVSATFDNVNPFKKFSSRYYDQYANKVWNKGSRYIEDAIGFDCFGFSSTSGSYNIRRNIPSTNDSFAANQSAGIFSQGMEPWNQAEVLSSNLQKTIHRAPEYDAHEETFTLPIDQPFLIEKAVFEVPMTMGPSWFMDKSIMLVTRSSGTGTGDNSLLMTGSNLFSSYTRYQNDGGPGITFSLLCQKNYGINKIRDLIAKSLVTHSNDINDTSIIKLDRRVPGLDNPRTVQYRANLLGINKYGIHPDVIINQPASGYFTGSIIAKCTSNVTNGVKLYYSADVSSSKQSSAALAISDIKPKIKNFLADPIVKTFSDDDAIGVREITGIDPYGRGFTGFETGGGSIFGGEFVSIDFENTARKNPFYLTSSTVIDALADEWETKFTNDNLLQPDGAGLYTAGMVFNTLVFLTGSKDNPYLIYPGQKLILAVSKTRPAIASAKLNILDSASNSNGEVDMLSSSYYNNLGSHNGHDVILTTGSINITIYGSYVKENGAYIP